MTDTPPMVPKDVTDRVSEVIEDILAHAPNEFIRYAFAVGILAQTAFRLTDAVPDLPRVLRGVASDLDRAP